MPAALPLQSKISQASQGDTQYRIIKNQFGNGFADRTPDGLNSIMDSWNVAWENITFADFTTVITALNASQGCDCFTWTAPGDLVEKKWVVTKSGRQINAGSVYSVTAALEQDFTL